MSGTLTLKGGLLELGMLMTGVIDTILVKASDNSYSRGWGGEEHKFEHPYTQTLFMFTAETLCMCAFLTQRFIRKRGKRAAGEPEEPPMGLWQLFPPYLAITMFLDFLTTSLSSIGLLYVKASVWQMLRGSNIIFSCILTRVMLKRRTLLYKWVAVAITIVGLVLVGLSSMLTTQHEAQASGSSEDEVSTAAWKTVIGIVLVIVAMMCNSTQWIVQEYLVRKFHYEPLQLSGTEGTFGVLLMIFVVLPVTYFVPGNNPSSNARGSYDNAIDCFLMMGHNIPLLFFILVYIVSDAFFNFFGVNITKYLSAVHRTIIDACRSILVWIWQLFTFYCISERFGEEWTKYSAIQVAGFVLLILGAIIYNGILRLPLFEYESEDENRDGQTAETGCELGKMDVGSKGGNAVAVELGDATDVRKPASDNAELGSSV
eukprot:m51a1_g9106 putative transmembrane protein c2orf18 homolog (429) ;mRNA; f:96179-97795